MKKFKLIKCYPGSPNPGTIVHDLTGTDSYIVDLSNKLIYRKEIEDYPEFWEEIKEEKRDYLVIDLKAINSITVISAVKRVSDGEIFKLGDRLILEKYMSGRKFIQIDRIYFNEHDQLSFSTKRDNVVPKIFVFGLSDINCRRYEPILTTEEGVEKYEGDEVFWIKDCSKVPVDQFKFILTLEFRIFKSILVDGFNLKDFPQRTYFDKKENAERYLEDTFPVFSKRQILEMLDRLTKYYVVGGSCSSQVSKEVKEYLNI